MKVLDFRGVSRSWLEDFKSALPVTSESSLAFVQEIGKSVTLGAKADESNIHFDYCEDNDIPIIRGTMPHSATCYHDGREFKLCAAINNASGNYIVSNARVGQHYLAKVVSSALYSLGLSAECKGNNILVSGKKIGLLGVFQFGEVIVFNSHILLDWDIDAAEKAIISPKHDMREHIRTLKQLGKDCSFDELKDTFTQAFQQVFEITFEEQLPTKELVDGIKASIEGLHPKYRSETWLKLGKWSPVKDYWRPE